MTEDEARAWLAARWPDCMAKLERYVALLLAEAEQQSLIARSTFASVWSRHIVDSAQLALLGPAEGEWLDVGSGGGLPGIVLAILLDQPIVMVEPRRKRVEFLERCIGELGLQNASVALSKVERLQGLYRVITARAVDTIEGLFAATQHVVSRETLYLLPRGEHARDELALARKHWHGAFHVEHSLTNPASQIVLAHEVRAR